MSGDAEVVELPDKLFCLDFEDENLNNSSIVTDTVSGIPLLSSGGDGVVFVQKAGFGRCVNTITNSSSNGYTAPLTNFTNLIGLPRARSCTFILWTDTNRTYSTTGDSGIMDVYDVGRIWGRFRNNGSLYLNERDFYIEVGKVGSPLKTDIGMYAYALEEDAITNELSAFHTINEENFTSFYLLFQPSTISKTILNRGTLRFLLSWESVPTLPSYTIAGITIYDGVLTNEQMKYIFKNKII